MMTWHVLIDPVFDYVLADEIPLNQHLNGESEMNKKRNAIANWISLFDLCVRSVHMVKNIRVGKAYQTIIFILMKKGKISMRFYWVNLNVSICIDWLCKWHCYISDCVFGHIYWQAAKFNLQMCCWKSEAWMWHFNRFVCIIF